MSKPEWGAKRVCPGCGGKYYDLRRTPILCPNCGVVFDPDSVLRSRRPKAAAKVQPKVAAKPKPKVVVVDDDQDLDKVELDDDDVGLEDLTGDDDAGNDAMIEDASELGEDDDELGDVVIKDDDKQDG